MFPSVLPTLLLTIACVCVSSFSLPKCGTPLMPSYIPDPLNCSRFYQCSNERYYLRECPNGLNFNPLVNTCDWPDNVRCHTVETTTSPPGSSDNPSTGSPEITTRSDDDEECTESYDEIDDMPDDSIPFDESDKSNSSSGDNEEDCE